MLLRCTYLGSFLLAACLAVPTHGVVIGDFEGSFGNWSGQSGAVISLDTFGATSGSNSVRVDMPEPGSWRTSLMYNVLAAGTMADLLANNKITFDVSWIASEWVGGSWGKVEAVIINGEGIGWNQLDLGTAAEWDPFNWGAEHTRSLSVDYSVVDFSALPANPGWLEIFIATNYDAAFTEGGVYYFDNITLVPEPTSLALLGMSLAGLALVRRRRNS